MDFFGVLTLQPYKSWRSSASGMSWVCRSAPDATRDGWMDVFEKASEVTEGWLPF